MEWQYKKNIIEYIVTNQLIRSGTSVGANIREAYNGESDKDFIHKMFIAQKECDENAYWIELMIATDLMDNAVGQILHEEAGELLKIIRIIILNKKQNME